MYYKCNYDTSKSKFQDEATGTNELVLERLWHRTGTTRFGVGGGRDVLIISADLPPHQPEAVARRPGQLTEEDKQKLLSQGVTSDCQSEVDIVRARYGLDKSCKIVDVMSEHSLAQDVSKSIKNLLNTTKNDGGMLVRPTPKLVIRHTLYNESTDLEVPNAHKN